MISTLNAIKDLYTALGGESADVLNANSEITVLNGILGLGSIGGCQFIPDAIKAIADNFALIDPSPAATLVEKTVSANGTYNATSDSANGYSKVTVLVDATLEDLTVEPSTQDYAIAKPVKPAGTAQKGYGDITVKGVTAAIDSNIKPENIKSGVTILGVLGTYGE